MASLKIYEPSDGTGQNTALGYQAGDALETGYNNTLLGMGTDASAIGAINQTVVGQGTTGQADNSVTLGNASVTAVYMASDSGATVYCSGVNFPDTQAASADANTLDDYEEGEYTVTLTPSGSGSITVSGTYDQSAYTKIGRQVTVMGAVDTSAISSPVGFIKVNLPFTTGDGNELAQRFSGSAVVYSASSNVQDYMVLGLESEDYFRIYLSTGTTLVATSANTIDATTSIAFTVTYFV